MPDKKPDQYDERAAVIVGGHQMASTRRLCLKQCVAAFGRQCAQEARRDTLQKAGDWFKAWKDMPASYERAGEALHRMAAECGKEG